MPYSNIIPSTSPRDVKIHTEIDELIFLEALSHIQDNFSEKLAEELFGHTISASDEDLRRGNIAESENQSDCGGRINLYIKALNLLFYVSKNSEGGIRELDREYIAKEWPKVNIFLLCLDGGLATDTLCDIVNAENRERMPNSSLIRPQATSLHKNIFPEITSTIIS